MVIRGTTDIIILPRRYNRGNNFKGGIQIAIELKRKGITEAHCSQETLQLILASCLSNYPVVVILTNLKKYWQFIWVSKSGLTEATLEPCPYNVLWWTFLHFMPLRFKHTWSLLLGEIERIMLRKIQRCTLMTLSQSMMWETWKSFLMKCLASTPTWKAMFA